MARFIEELTLKVKAHYIAKGLKLGLAQSGIEVGKGKGHAAARAWNERRLKAQADGEPFNEPYPFPFDEPEN